MTRSEDTRQVPLMSLNRFEAFSDGVFAIAVTLLVLEIKAPDLTHATSSEALIIPALKGTGIQKKSTKTLLKA